MQEKDEKFMILTQSDALLMVGDKNGMALVKTEIFQDFVGQVVEGLTK